MENGSQEIQSTYGKFGTSCPESDPNLTVPKQLIFMHCYVHQKKIVGSTRNDCPFPAMGDRTDLSKLYLWLADFTSCMNASSDKKGFRIGASAKSILRKGESPVTI